MQKEQNNAKIYKICKIMPVRTCSDPAHSQFSFDHVKFDKDIENFQKFKIFLDVWIKIILELKPLNKVTFAYLRGPTGYAINDSTTQTRSKEYQIKSNNKNKKIVMTKAQCGFFFKIKKKMADGWMEKKH